MLPIDAPPEEIARFGELLRRFASEDPAAFDGIFGPTSKRTDVPAKKEIAVELARFGLIGLDEKSRSLESIHRVRRRGDRVYVMEIGGVMEYHQDLWPETDSLLDVLEGASTGSLLDMGTGTGIVAVEA